MLCELRVKNLALIESLHLQFDSDQKDALIVMTGETGAGKSVMLRAIHLLSGRRAAVDWIRSGEESCEVEALFEINPEHKELLNKLEKGGFSEDAHLVIRRVLTTNGRSRFYVNGTIATAKIVAELTVELLNVASQHDQQQLLQTAVHLDLLDTVGDLWQKRDESSQAYRLWKKRKATLEEMVKREQEKEQRQDFLRFQVGEISEAALLPQEDELLTAEKKRLKNGQTLITLAQESYYLLAEQLTSELTQLRQNVTQLATLDEHAAKLSEEISEYTFRAEDFVAELHAYKNSLEIDPYRLEEVNERLNLISQLKRKYGETIDHILQFAEEGEAELLHLENMDKEIAELKEEVGLLEKDLLEKSLQLRSARQKSAEKMANAMTTELSSLSFESPQFVVHFEEIPQDKKELLEVMGSTGCDVVEFFFSANPGESPKPLAKIASGGELSRLLLAMKCILAKKDMVDTVVFDEVDTGIGGEAAEAVARKIQELAGHHQVFCITHLPQIAARGSIHLQVAKSVVGERTRTTVEVLDKESRVRELVRMLAGESGSMQTEAWAEELLAKSEAKAA